MPLLGVVRELVDLMKILVLEKNAPNAEKISSHCVTPDSPIYRLECMS